jgi:hypothetical protein
MRSDAAAYLNEDIERVVLVELWASATPTEIIDGSATGAFDLSPFVARCQQTENKLTVELRYHSAFLDCNAQPQPGQLLTVKTDGTIRFSGVIEAINQFTEERGTRMMSITARLRDGFGGWKTAHITSSVYPQGTSYVAILDDICGRVMDLEDNEYTFPQLSYTVPHTNSQFADETPWDILTNVLFAANMTPYVDVLNRVTAHEKSVVRASTLSLGSDRVIRINGAKQTQKTSRVRLRWLDPELTKTSQQDQVLYSTAMTAGFFNWRQKEKTWFSEDRTQRAENTYMVIIDSVNAGIVPVADEVYEQVTQYYGKITLQTYFWVPSIAVAGLAAMTAQALVPDLVSTAPGETTPVGRVLVTAANIAVIATMMSMGVGRYEIRGIPFDYVNAKNTTLAYADNIADWAASEVEIDNDLIANEGHAQLTATEHLIWLGSSAYAYGATIVDDPRIEVGDIVEFEDGARLLVQSFSNNYTRGAKATMELNGFRV